MKIFISASLLHDTNVTTKAVIMLFNFTGRVLYTSNENPNVKLILSLLFRAESLIDR